MLTADAFNVANTVPNIIYILLAGGVLNTVFVPQVVRAMKEGAERERAYTDRLLTLAGLVLAAITLVATLAAPLVVALYTPSTWSDADVAVAVAFAAWCLPQIFFYGIYTMLGQILNARGSFGPMMWAPIVNNLVAIVVGLVFIAVFTVDPAAAGRAVGDGHRLPRRRCHPRRRPAGRRARPGAAPHRLRLPAAVRLPRLRPRQGRRARPVDAAVRPGQPAGVRRHRQPRHPRQRGGQGRPAVRRRLHRLLLRLPDLHPAALGHHRLGGDRLAAADEPRRRRRAGSTTSGAACPRPGA